MVTIGFVAKEKFSLAARALETLLRNTPAPFQLVIVDCNVPRRYRVEMERVLRGRSDVSVISVDRYLQPNQSKNLVIRNAEHELIALVENDTFVPPGWLEAMRDALEEYRGECVVFPGLFEGSIEDGRLHMDGKLGRIEKWTEDGVVVREILPDPGMALRYRDRSRRIIGATEIHVFLAHRRILERIGLLDENLTTREHFDLSLQLHEGGIPIVLEGAVQAIFYQAPPVHLDEWPFWYFVWSPAKAARTNAYLVKKWNLVNYPSSLGYARRQMWRVHAASWRFVKRAVARSPALAAYFSGPVLRPRVEPPAHRRSVSSEPSPDVSPET